jgi:hypothetical protein
MTSIFPVSASVGQEFSGYNFDGESWNLIGNEFNPTSFSSSPPLNPKAGDLWVDSDEDVNIIDDQNLVFQNDLDDYLSLSSASANYATKIYADNSASVAAAALVDAAPSTLNTLNELAAALGDDANFASTVSTSLGNKLDISTASATYLTQVSASNTYLTQTSASTNYVSLIGNLRIKQIVSGSTTTEIGNNTNTYIDSTLTATITPTSASNKIVVIYQQGSIRKSGGNQNSAMDLILLRDATQLAYHGALYTVTALELRVPGPGGIVVDSPETTSAVTYKTQFRNTGAFDGVICQIQNSRGSILLVEVEGL